LYHFQSLELFSVSKIIFCEFGATLELVPFVSFPILGALLSEFSSPKVLYMHQPLLLIPMLIVGKLDQ
jgi:hypothetical protein